MYLNNRSSPPRPRPLSFFSFSCSALGKRKNKEDLCVGRGSIPSLTVSLPVQADAPLFPAPLPSLPAELVPQRMPPGRLPLSTTQEGSSLPTPLLPGPKTPLPTGHSANRTFQNILFPSLPTRRMTKQAFRYYFRAFFFSLLQPIHSAEALPGWQARDEPSSPNDLQRQLLFRIKA